MFATRTNSCSDDFNEISEALSLFVSRRLLFEYRASDALDRLEAFALFCPIAFLLPPACLFFSL